jgi:hypothetical protein
MTWDSTLARPPGPAESTTTPPRTPATPLKSKAAAAQQVRTGHYKPVVRPKIYRQNSESDADRDGTACEVTR